ncbi:MAG: phosphatase NudJ [Myxococcota bacterium]|jgi:phosphatase NudJ
MSREPVRTWFFALVVVRLGHRFLLVRERKHGQRWYLPAGRVEPGERLQDGALRETLEESGVPVALDGILRIQFTPGAGGTARCRVIFVAHPVDDTPPLSAPNEHALEARWVTLSELSSLPMRGDEVAQIFDDIEAGAPIYPMSLLSSEVLLG